jgi:hypothetical protein
MDADALHASLERTSRRGPEAPLRAPTHPRAPKRFPPDFSNIRDLAVQLLREAARVDGPCAPWLRALPTLAPPPPGAGRQLHAETLPPEYLPLIGSRLQEARVADVQRDTDAFWAANGAALAREGFSLDDVRAAVVTVGLPPPPPPPLRPPRAAPRAFSVARGACARLRRR